MKSLTVSSVSPNDSPEVQDQAASQCGCIMSMSNLRSSPKPNHRCMIVMEWDDILFPSTLIHRISNRILNLISKNKSLTIKKEEYHQLQYLSLFTYNTLIEFRNKYSSENFIIISTSPLKLIQDTLKQFKSIGHFNQIYDLLFKTSEIRFIHPEITCLPFKSRQDIIKYKQVALAKICCDPCINSNNINSIACCGDDLYKIAIRQTINLLTIYIHFIHRVKLMPYSSPNDSKYFIEQLEFLKVFYNEYGFDYFSQKYQEIDVDYALFKLLKKLRKKSMNKVL